MNHTMLNFLKVFSIASCTSCAMAWDLYKEMLPLAAISTSTYIFAPKDVYEVNQVKLHLLTQNNVGHFSLNFFIT